MIFDTLAALADYRNNHKFDSGATKAQCCEVIANDLQSVNVEILMVGGEFILNDEIGKFCPFVYGMQHRTPMSSLGTCPPLNSSSSSQSTSSSSNSSSSWSSSSSSGSSSYSSFSDSSLSCSSSSSSSSAAAASLSWYCVQGVGGTTCEDIVWGEPFAQLGCAQLTAEQVAAYPEACFEAGADWWVVNYLSGGPYATSDECWLNGCLNPNPM